MRSFKMVGYPSSLKLSSLKIVRGNSKLLCWLLLCGLISSSFCDMASAQQSRRRGDLPPKLQKQIDDSVRKAAAHLTDQLKKTKRTGYRSLGAYALMSANDYLELEVVIDPVCKDQLNHIVGKFAANGVYRPMLGVPVYEAGVDLLALSKAHKISGAYKKQIEAIVRFLQKDQDPTGFWLYPRGTANRDRGDTSMTQYAVLGLWSAEILGNVRVPANVWKKATQWHLDTQYSSGAFAYHPGTKSEGATLTMSAAGLGSLLICRRVMSGAEVPLVTKKKKQGNRKFVDLTPANTGQTKEEREAARKLKATKNRRAIPFDKALLNAGIGNAKVWMNSNIKIPSLKYPLYYLYSIERIGFFQKGNEMFGRDWYRDGAKFLIDSQTSDGGWRGGVRPSATASYGILFLTRATEAFEKDPGLADGILEFRSGGFDPNELPFPRGGRPNPARTDSSTILNKLEDIKNIDFTKELIPQLVKQVEFDLKRKYELEKNKTKVKELLKHQKWQVRQVAVWALGKTGDLNDVTDLIAALADEKPDVMREAHIALCYISRKPLGPKDKQGKSLPIGPLENLAKNANDEERTQAAQKWSRESVERWEAWYLRVRPYEKRDDLKDGNK